MTWFYVDDGLHSHPKVIESGTSSMGLWVRSGSWCADQLTDGRVPLKIAKQFGTAKMAERLVDAGLWVPDGSGYAFHQWNDPGRQPTRAEVEDRRRKRSEAGALGGKRSGEARRTGSNREASASRLLRPLSNPVPSRPFPNKHLLALVRRRLQSDARVSSTTTTDEDLWMLWTEAVGEGVDLAAELKLWFMRNADTDLRHPHAALLGWLRKARQRAEGAAPLGCAGCSRGWLPDDPDGRPAPCPSCRPHLRPVAS